MAWDAGHTVQHAGIQYKVQGSAFELQGAGFEGSGSGIRVSGLGSHARTACVSNLVRLCVACQAEGMCVGY